MPDTAVANPAMEAAYAKAMQVQPSAGPPATSDAMVQNPAMDAAYAQAKQLQPQVSSTRQTIEPVPGLQGFIDNINKQLNIGTDSLGSDIKSFTNLGLGNQSYKDFEEEDTAYHALQKAMHREDDINTAVHDNLKDALEPMGTTVGNAMIQSVPALGATGAGMAVGAGIAFTVGAPVTVPLLIGGATVGAVIGAGGMIKSLREHGADPNIARAGGLLAGAANAATMFIGGAGAGKVAETVVEQGTKQVLIQMAKSMGLTFEANELNALADTGIKLASQKYTYKELQKELLVGTATSLVMAPTLGVGGALLGRALRPMATAGEHVKALTEHFNKLIETRKAERFEKARAEMFPEVVAAEEEAKKQVKAELVKPKGESAAPLQGRVEQNNEIALLKNQIADLEKELANEKEQPQEVPQNPVKYNVNELPKDNYLKPLSEYTDVLYRETNAHKAAELLGGVRVNITQDQIYMSNTPELALGQEGNRGILIKFNAKDLQGQLNRQKPTWELFYKQGQIEVIAKLNEQSKYVNAVEEVTIASDLKTNSVDKAILQRALKDRGLTKTVVNEDGSTTYSKGAEPELFKATTTKQRLQEAESNLAKAQKEATKEEAENNQKAEAEKDALDKAEEINKKIQEENYIPDTVDEAVLTAQLAQGAASKLAKGKPIFQSKKKLIGGIKAFWERYSPASRISGYATVSPAGKHRIIFQDHPNADPLIAKLDTFHAVQAYDTLNRQHTDKYYGHLEASTGLNRDELNWLMFKAPSDELSVDYVGADGQPVHEDISADQAISYVSLMKNKDALAALTDSKTGNNMTVNTPELPGKLTTEKAYMDALETANPAYLGILEGRANFYAEMGPELKALVAKNEPGREFNLQENYGITIRRKGAVEAPVTDYTPTVPGGDYINPTEGLPNNAPGFINERGPSKIAIEVDGCFQADRKRCRQQARYQAMWEPAKLWNALKSSPEFKKAVVTKFRNGEMLYNSAMSSYDDAVHYAAKAEDGWDKFCNLYLKSRAVHTLGFNPAFIPKHLATFYNFTLYKYKGKFIPPEALLKGAKSAMSHPKAAAKLVLGWEDIKTRYADINQLAAITSDEAENPIYSKFRRGSTSMLRVGDQGAVIMGGKAVYDYVFEQTGNAKIAEKEAVKAINEVLASGNRAQISSMARHPVGRIFANLHQPQMRLAQHALEAQRLAANHPTKENVANAVRVTAINHIASGLFSLPSVALAGAGAVITGNATGLSESAYQAYSNFATGAIFPVGDSAVKAAFTEANNYTWDDKHHVWELSAGPLESMHKSYIAGSDVLGLVSGRKEADFDNVFKAGMHGIQGPGSLLPIPEWPIKVIGAGVSTQTQ